MKLLAVDTTSNRIQLAIGDGRSAVLRSIEAAGAHDEKIFAEVDRLLKKSRQRLQAIDGLVAASGPGSFTGIRIGMTFVSVLSQALGKPAISLSLLEAEGARALRGGVSVAGVVLSAARDELFFQVFTSKKSSEPKWIASGGWLKEFQTASRSQKGMVLVGSAAEKAASLLGGKKPPVHEAPPLCAVDLIAPAIEKLKAGHREFEPLYLKPAYYERNPPRLVR